MPDSSFDVTRFENRNGVISWRVSGWLHGLRVRKNFKSREEAGAEMAALEAKAAQAAGNVRGTSTFLTDDQLREAEASFRRLIGAPKSLSFYLDYALATYRAPEREMSASMPTISPAPTAGPWMAEITGLLKLIRLLTRSRVSRYTRINAG